MRADEGRGFSSSKQHPTQQRTCGMLGGMAARRVRQHFETNVNLRRGPRADYSAAVKRANRSDIVPIRPSYFVGIGADPVDVPEEGETDVTGELHTTHPLSASEVQIVRTRRVGSKMHSF